MSNSKGVYGYQDDLEELEYLPAIRNVSQGELRPSRMPRPARKSKPPPASFVADLAGQADGLENFDFSYNASRHERQWIIDSLGSFYEGQWLDDILRLLKGGKEASVYQCRPNPAVTVPSSYVAAKIYRPRRFRNLKNDHLYREGRAALDADGNEIIDGRMHHAMENRTQYGRRLMHTSWIEHEYQTMQILHEAGADIPIPYTRGNNAILMEYIGERDLPAPTLNTVKLEPEEAEVLFKRIIHNVELMLSNQRIHGDLSAYNVLYWEGDIKLIDFPQSINPHENRNAYLFFKRDIRRICEYFERQGVESNARMVTTELWTSQGYRLRPNVHPGLLDDQDEDDYTYWKRMARSGE